ncbi:MAG TPA: SRPBCC family protein [Ktedonobacteraceae bacterium]|nr:SRPBCC family protein [Ktedonobacteraceae bacterium]
MSKTRFEASAVIDARPEEIYAVLVDYRDTHPRIVPAGYLYNLKVEEGGYGAGTIFTYSTRIFGIENPARAVVSEPEPGRVLMETVSPMNFVTTFTMTPIANGQQTHLTIATAWPPARNLRERLEHVIYPLVMKPMYTKELALIAAFMKSKNAQAV